VDVQRVVELALPLGAEYAEVREERRLLRTEIPGSEEIAVSTRSIGGFGVRVLAESLWGFVSVSSLEDLEWAVRKAVKLVRVGKSNVRLAKVKPVRDRVRSGMKVKPPEMSLSFLRTEVVV